MALSEVKIRRRHWIVPATCGAHRKTTLGHVFDTCADASRAAFRMGKVLGSTKHVAFEGRGGADEFWRDSAFVWNTQSPVFV